MNEFGEPLSVVLTRSEGMEVVVPCLREVYERSQWVIDTMLDNVRIAATTMKALNAACAEFEEQCRKIGLTLNPPEPVADLSQLRFLGEQYDLKQKTVANSQKLLNKLSMARGRMHARNVALRAEHAALVTVDDQLELLDFAVEGIKD